MREPVTNSVGMELVGIDPGRFRMGSDGEAAAPGPAGSARGPPAGSR